MYWRRQEGRRFFAPLLEMQWALPRQCNVAALLACPRGQKWQYQNRLICVIMCSAYALPPGRNRMKEAAICRLN